MCNILHHYTSLNALLSILKSQEIWLSSSSDMNDYKESVFYLENLEKELLLIIDDKDKTKFQTFWAKLKCRLENEKPFLMSLSNSNDDISQWDRYADKGRGVVISFNKQALDFFRYNGYSVDKVIYGYQEKKNYFYKCIPAYISQNKQVLKSNNWDFDDGAIDNILSCASSVKHHGFRMESETRIVKLTNIPLKNFEHIEQKLVGNRIKNMLIVDLKKTTLKIEDLVDEVILGPCVEFDIDEFIQVVKKDIPCIEKIVIKKSDIPFR